MKKVAIALVALLLATSISVQDFNFDKTHAHASFSIKHIMVSKAHGEFTT